jgi:hypothetical protein
VRTRTFVLGAGNVYALSPCSSSPDLPLALEADRGRNRDHPGVEIASAGPWAEKGVAADMAPSQLLAMSARRSANVVTSTSRPSAPPVRRAHMCGWLAHAMAVHTAETINE